MTQMANRMFSTTHPRGAPLRQGHTVGSVGKGSANLVSIVPYFKVLKGNEAKFKTLVTDGFYPRMTAEAEPLCLFYNFTYGEADGVMIAHCREVYEGAQGVLTHLTNVDAQLQQATAMAELFRIEVHGPQAELDQLDEPLKGLNPTYFVQST